MSDKAQILLVDDDASILALVKLYLEKEGYDVKTASRGDDALNQFRQHPPALILLDIMLPGMDGWEVLKEVRKVSGIPVIMLTAKDETFDKVLGLELGADDYVSKPFDSKELIARVKAVIRRTRPTESSEREATFTGLKVDMDRFSVMLEGKEIEMPPKELELLYYLASHPNRVFTREQLLTAIWGFDFYGDSRTVDVHVKRVREKIGSGESLGWQIKTVWGVGYKFEVK